MPLFDINRITTVELAERFAIGHRRALAITTLRDELGGFASWDDVRRLPGIDNTIIRTMREDGLAVGVGRRRRRG